MSIKSRFARIALSLAVILSLFMATLLLTAATEQDVERLKVGMTKDEVRQIMGKPDSESDRKVGDLCGRWTYKKIGRYRFVNVWFGCKDQTLVLVDKAE
jgi:hypothetical protein